MRSLPSDSNLAWKGAVRDCGLDRHIRGSRRPAERGQTEEQKMKTIIQCGFALILIASSLATRAAAGDVIADCNAIAEKEIKAAKDPLPVTSVEFAMVQVAIYDAVESIDRRYEPYHASVPNASGSMSVAAAQAGHDVRVPLNLPPFVGNNAIGQWRPTPSLLPGPPPSFAPGLVPWMASVTPFSMKSNAQFRVDPPPDLP